MKFKLWLETEKNKTDLTKWLRLIKNNTHDRNVYLQLSDFLEETGDQLDYEVAKLLRLSIIAQDKKNRINKL